MKEVIKKYFIPHEGNDYKPHFFRAEAALIFAGFLLLLTFLTYVYSAVIGQNSSFLAAVVPPALIELANDDRASASIAPLKINPLLILAAELKAQDMAANGYFSHTSPAGLSPWYWFGKAGYNFSYAGENLAIDFSESADVNYAWMNSPGHRANIMNKNFTEIGIATAKGFYQGRETVFVVQLFGKPVKSAATAPAPAPKVSPTAVPKVAPTTSPKPTVIPVNKPVVAEANLEVIPNEVESTDMFLAVKNLDAGEVFVDPDINLAGLFESAMDSYTGKLFGIITSPKISLAYLYLFFGIMVSIALLLMVFVEVRVQHPKHIIYGIMLLLLIGGLIYLNIDSIRGGVMVI